MGKIDLLQGNLEMMILRILSSGSRHGWGIAQRIHLLSEAALRIEEGSLYLALYRMQRKGWIRSEWGQSRPGTVTMPARPKKPLRNWGCSTRETQRPCDAKAADVTGTANRLPASEELIPANAWKAADSP